MSNKPLQFTTPTVRVVGGSVYEAKTTDHEGNPLTVKSGPNAGQPRVEFSFALAFPKQAGHTHWAQDPFLKQFWDLGHASFPNGEAQRHDFAWKIQDGDSTVPNRKGKKNCDRPGYPGHWIMWLSSGQAPQFWDAKGTQRIPGESIKTGYYVQVFGNAVDNKPSPSPGLYMNHSMVALAGYGEEIVVGPDVSAAGFGQSVAPAGMMAAPPAGFTPPAPPAGAAPAVPGASVPPPVPAPAAPVVPARVMLPAANGATYEQLIANGWTDALLVQHGMMAAPAAAAVPPPLPGGSAPTVPAPVPTAPAAAPLPVTPNPALLQVPGATPAPPVPAPAAPARVMLPAANGATYDQLVAAGWTDALLVQHGMMQA